jgi:NADH-quinone oxidoreductase subunit C
MTGTALSLSELPSALAGKFPGKVTPVPGRKDMLAALKVLPEAIVPVSQFLRDQGTFEHCALVSGVDWIDRIEVLYHLWSDEYKGYLELSVDLPADEPHVASVTPVWSGANWHERETWDMLGVRFDGHPDLRRVLMPEGYRFHPLRKSFELREPEELEVKARHV